MSALFSLLNQDIDTSFVTLEPTIKSIHDPRIAEQIGVAAPVTFQEIIEGSTINTYIEHGAFEPFVTACAQALLHRPDLLASLREGTIRTSEDLRTYSDRYVHRVEELSTEEVAEVLRETSRLQTECTVQGVVVAFADIFGVMTEQTTAILRERKDLPRPAHFYSQLLTRPLVRSLAEQAKEIIYTSEGSDESILRQFYWLDQGYIGCGLLKKNLEEIRSHHFSHVEEISFEDAASELGLDPDERRVFSVAADLIFIKSLRADSRQFGHVLVNRLVDRLAKEWTVSPLHLSTLSPQELVDVIEGKCAYVALNLEQRFTHSLRVAQKIYFGKEADEFLAQSLFRQTITNRTEVKGQVANPGKVTGRARLVFGPQHNGKIKEGDVLVSTATSPQLLPAMKRAAAFVTDVGGVTSHAAIVARELSKPCVVGTKYATEIFIDGDMIEVDAEKGIVKKLS